MKRSAAILLFCWMSFAHAVVDTEARNVHVCLRALDSELKGLFFNSQLFFGPNMDLPMQVITTDKSVLAKGAISAVITPDGKVVQIRSNGSCELTDKGLNSVHEFIAKQIAQPGTFERLKLAVPQESQRRIQKICQELPKREPYSTIRSTLNSAWILNSGSGQLSPSPATAIRE